MNNQNPLQPRMNQKKAWNAARWEMSQPVFCGMREEAIMEVKGTPVVTEMQVIPVAGYDSMLMTLSGAHAPWFTRNLVILKDSAGHTGIVEIHGGDYTCAA